VAGSRRDRDDAEARTARPAPAPRKEGGTTGATAASEKASPRPAPSKPTAAAKPTRSEPAVATASPKPGKKSAATARPSRSARSTPAATTTAPRRRSRGLASVLALLCLVAAAGVGLLLWQRLNPSYVDSSIFAATREGVQALYAYDYKHSDESIKNKLAVLTGDLRQQYEEDLQQGGIIDTYEQVSATTRYEVLDVGLQQVNDAQDTATLVVFGQYVVQSVNSGDQPAPDGSECQVTPEGAQSCTQTVQVRVLKVDGDWKISELTLLTTS
jgi:hypothetical protein